MKDCSHIQNVLKNTFLLINKLTKKYFITPFPDYNEIKSFLENFQEDNLEEFNKLIEDFFAKIELKIILCNKESSEHIKKVLLDIREHIKTISSEIGKIDKHSKQILEKVNCFDENSNREELKGEIQNFFEKFIGFINKLNSKIDQINGRLEDEIKNQLLKDKQIEELKEKVYIDELTGLLNKRGFDEVYDRLSKLEQKLNILFIDIDNFKKVNDTFGHIAGDLILKKVSEILKKNLRDEDIVARIYGDEFIVLFKNLNKETAYYISERIRKTIANGKFIYNDKEIKITISGGLSSIKTWLSKDKNIEIADKLLYRAKQSGNRIEVEK